MEYYEELREVSYNGDTGALVIHHPGLSRASWPAVQWSIADDLGKWVLVTLTEVAIVTAFAAFLTEGAVGWAIFFLFATILPFAPFIQARELCRQQKMFVFPSYSGPGNAWGKYLLRYAKLFHSFHKMTHDKNATDKVKAVYAEREPAVWQTISAISNLYGSVVGKGTYGVQ